MNAVVSLDEGSPILGSFGELHGQELAEVLRSTWARFGQRMHFETPAITVKQPWGHLIASGRKTIELRYNRASHRGLFLLAAGVGERSKDGIAAVERFEIPEESMPGGVALALCELYGVRRAQIEDTERACCVPDVEEGEYAWEVRVVQLVRHRKVRGMPGWWRFRGQLEAV